MYLALLSFHNWLRWAVLIFGVLALVLALVGWLGKKEWTPTNRILGILFATSIDIQLLLGLILYFFLSPWTRPLLQGNMSAAMANSESRFFSVEHIFVMILAVVFVHLGTAMARRADDSVKKHRAAAIWFTLTFLLILGGIPWWRPLLRFFNA